MRALVFECMLHLCHRENQLSTILDNVKNVEQVSKEWTLSPQERRHLYKACSRVLDEVNEDWGAF